MSTQHRGELLGHSDGRRVSRRRLPDQPWASHRCKSQLWEGSLDCVREVSRRDMAGNRSDSSDGSKLQHRSLASIPGGRDADISLVDVRHWQQWLRLPAEASPGFSVGVRGNVATFPFIDVLLHLVVKFGATLVGFSCKEFGTFSSFICRTSKTSEIINTSSYKGNPKQCLMDPSLGSSGKCRTFL